MSEKFYTINQVAETLDMHHKTIRKFIADGNLPASKLGKQWRIAEEDLKVFMNTSEKPDIAYNVEYSAIDTKADKVKRRVQVSTVVDIEQIQKEEYLRISNTLIAVMNCKDAAMQDAPTLNVKYYEKEKRIRIMLWGSVRFIEELLGTITLLVENITLGGN
ncbi:2-hydroxyacid dehydrogenase [Anaerocolumna cellulosilytica]|uniref:2-hydroxyacid dehydrogenase n=1 Tax=Anaerocolumna cellulosilytica TaxID=433286 RepID=A0A6S6QXX6_9FIRM|nr:helix-turn-helix domain-containing protein [Anaerocolumna cellulosilytica]MBB5196655.1 excisionase family DNA binding protein [Anaerocolumna cellulosilytica]BCJ93919.1 2-hydroxyacid dehydrogenase [Anaerocolumna cellulosilytica]